ncbi:MAG: hypothetical protein F6K14_01625 [Symploca sp. SIO2C1]|nr:hypothetical protein [Symploca sp. SIO2C1]
MTSIYQKATVGATGLTLSLFAFLGNHQQVQATTIFDVAGDQDCFGTSISPCDFIRSNQIIQEPDDGDFDFFRTGSFNWTHNYTLPVGSNITGARLTIVTLDVEDNGAGDGQGGEPFDDRLFLDGLEVLEAFDNTFTPDLDRRTPKPVNSTVFNLDASFFSVLRDGNIDVQVVSDAGVKSDFIAIDFATLELTVSETSSVPEPVSVMSILAFGTFGVGSLLKGRLSGAQEQPNSK